LKRKIFILNSIISFQNRLKERKKKNKMFDIPAQYEGTVNVIFLAVTALIAYHDLTYRNKDGESNWVHLLFGCIAGVYFFLVLFKDVLKVISF
jgi:hypothetical protein